MIRLLLVLWYFLSNRRFIRKSSVSLLICCDAWKSRRFVLDCILERAHWNGFEKCWEWKKNYIIVKVNWSQMKFSTDLTDLLNRKPKTFFKLLILLIMLAYYVFMIFFTITNSYSIQGPFFKNPILNSPVGSICSADTL